MTHAWLDWSRRLAKYYAALLKHSGATHDRHLHAFTTIARRGLVADLSAFDVDVRVLLAGRPVVLELGDEPESDIILEDFEDSDDSTEDDAGAREPDPAATASRTAERSSLMRIYRKQTTDPYNRETIVGFPLIGGRSGAQLISGPLLYWNCQVRYDAGSERIFLSLQSTTPSLNTTLLSRFDPDEALPKLLGEQVVAPHLVEEAFAPASIERVVNAVRGTVEPLRGARTLVGEEGAGLRGWLEALKSAGGQPVIGQVPVLINGSRTFAFLMEDLEHIAGLEDLAGNCVLGNIVGDLPEGIGDVEGTGLPFLDTADGGDPLWFPFPSNRAQREVAEATRRGEVLTVQGPPGTGKSLTIANIVCDLVARGRTVLVTSHQSKALEVVAAKLPSIDHLAMAVLRNDRESMDRLRAQLGGTNSIQSESIASLQEKVDSAEQGLHRHDEELRRLARRYSELRSLEHENWERHWTYAELREFDRIDPEDDPSADDVSKKADSLREWADLVRVLAPALTEVRALFTSSDSIHTRAGEDQTASGLQVICRLWETLESAPDDRVRAVLEALETSSGEADLGVLAAELRRFATWCTVEAPTLFELIDQEGSDRSAWPEWHTRARRVPGDELDSVEDLLAGLRAYVDSIAVNGTDLRIPEPANLEAVARSLEVLASAAPSMWRWLVLPSVKRARRELAGAGFPAPSRTAAPATVDRVRVHLEWYSKRAAARSTLERLTQLVPEWKGPPSGAEDPPRLAAAVRAGTRAVRALRLARNVPLLGSQETPTAEVAALLAAGLSPGGRRDTARVAAEVADRIDGRRECAKARRSLQIYGRWKERIEAACGAIETGRVPRDGSLLRQLRAVLTAYDRFRRLRDLETLELSDLPVTRRALEEAIIATRTVPEWVASAERALEARRLGRLMHQTFSADPDDMTQVADRLASGQRKRRQLIEEAIRRKRRLQVRRALQEPRTAIQLRGLQKLLRQRRMSDSFVALRGRIEYQEVLKVFPAWICTIDDVARLFPLQPGLFDVLIVDEASQCNQATALPLAFRAKRMVVVGDEQQLQPATTRFLANANVTVLQERFGINEHPRAQFLDGKSSLLDLAESCHNWRGFLNEHFRCDPAIIRWSNERFYNNRLAVLTRQRASGFRCPLEVRTLNDADDDREKKVNIGEARAVVREARRLIESGEADRMTIGLISPFRQQADLMHSLILREFADHPDWIDRHQLIASTADGFQGDERDIILYSFRYGPSTSPGTVTAIQNEYQRLNVAFTRAKRKAVLFISTSMDRFPRGHVRDFLEHARMVELESRNGTGVRPRREDKFDSEFERDVCERLRNRGYAVTTQEPCAGFLIDLVVEDADGRCLGVECDGQWKHDPFGNLRPEDYQRQDILERAGWSIHRVSGGRYCLNPEAELERLISALELQPTAADRSIAMGPLTSDDSIDEVLSDLSSDVGEGDVEAVEYWMDDLEDVDALYLEISDEGSVLVTPADENDREVLPAELAFMGELQVTPIFAVRGLARWFMFHGRLEQRGEETLNECLEIMQAGRSLTPARAAYLRELWNRARQSGFDPNNDFLD